MSEKRDRDRGEGLSVMDLGIAAASSALAAVMVSKFWADGTAISAAVTPVLVTLIREAIARPTAKVTEVTARRREQVDIPAAAGAAAPYDEEQEEIPPAYDQGGAFDAEPGVSVYGRSSRNKLHFRLALITGLLGFAIAAVLLTAPELITGKSLTGDGKRTTLFQGKESRSKKNDEDATTTTPDAVTTEEPTIPQEEPPASEPVPTVEAPAQPEIPAQPQQDPAPQAAPTP